MRKLPRRFSRPPPLPPHNGKPLTRLLADQKLLALRDAPALTRAPLHPLEVSFSVGQIWEVVRIKLAIADALDEVTDLRRADDGVLPKDSAPSAAQRSSRDLTHRLSPTSRGY